MHDDQKQTTAPTTASVATWGGNPPAIVMVDGIAFAYAAPVAELGTGAFPMWPQGVVVNGIAYWREE
jgi:hypothetical protein